MTKTTKLIKQNDDVYHIDIPEEYVSRLGWENGYLLKIDVDDNKIVIEKLSGFMGMWFELSIFVDVSRSGVRCNFD